MSAPVRRSILLLLLLVSAGVLWRISAPSVPPKAKESSEGKRGVAAARIRSGPKIRAAVEQAGLPYPPREIFIRALKEEAQLEVWAREDALKFQLVASFAILTSSGKPGPKRREGDLQVPEGFYRIDRFNPESRFHLSLGLDYPNAADRMLSDRGKPGSDIFIHGKDVTIGCLPLGDAAIEEVYLLALDTRQRGQRTIHVHLLPARMTGPEWETFRAAHSAALQEFWAQLQPAFDAFERTRRVPEIVVDRAGRYSIGAQSE